MGQRKRQRELKKVQTPGLVAIKRPRSLPPPESELWPEYCRGKNWTWESACFYVGRCQLCAYSCPPTPGRRRLDKLTSMPTFLVCTNHPDSPGELREVLPTGMCRNFKAVRWLRPTSRKAKPDSAMPESNGAIRRIPLGHDLFATVDAADFEELSKYKWCASRQHGIVYAVRRTKQGRTAYMHREIMRAPKGYIVDHIDHNTLNNRRCNLRVCTPEQNYANAGPRGGSSRFVGVYRRGKKWVAGITWRGEHFYLGSYDEEVEAAKVRDRKAYELHGLYAYLNFPEDYGR